MLADRRIGLQLHDRLYLDNLEARRDWSHAADYVRAMWLMLQHSSPEDFVVATGYSVRDFLEVASRYATIDWRAHMGTDARYFRRTKVDSLEGDAGKAKRLLNRQPEVTFEALIEWMREHDLEIARQAQTLILAGYTIAPRGGAHV